MVGRAVLVRELVLILDRFAVARYTLMAAREPEKGLCPSSRMWAPARIGSNPGLEAGKGLADAACS